MARSSPSTSMRVLGLVSVIGAIVVIVNSGEKSVSEVRITQQLDNFKTHLESGAAMIGSKATLSHGAVKVKEGIFSNTGELEGLSIEIKQPGIKGEKTTTLSTPAVKILPDPMHSRRVYYTFEQPISVKENGAQQYSIVFEDALKYGFVATSNEDKQHFEHLILLPTSISINEDDGEGEDMNTAAVITYDPGAVIDIRSNPAAKQRTAHYDIRNISVTETGEGDISAAAFISNSEEKPGEGDLVDGTYHMQLSALQMEGMQKPCDATADVNYKGDQPLRRLMGMLPALAGAGMNVKDVTLDCGDFKLVTEGNLARTGEDPLPSGQLSIAISDVRGLLSSTLLDEQTKTIISQVLTKVSGQPVESLTNTTITLKREAGGTLFIGDVTFEQLATGLMTEMFNFGKPMPARPVPMPGAHESPDTEDGQGAEKAAPAPQGEDATPALED